MRRIIVVFSLCTVLFKIGCNAQRPIKKEERESLLFPAPCFLVEMPDVISLPDSFMFKQKEYYAILNTDCYYDSLGVVFKIEPQQIYLRNKITNKLEKKYSYWKGWEDRAINMTKEEALKYSDWAVKELPLLTKMKRVPPNIKCTQKITNRNILILEYRLE